VCVHLTNSQKIGTSRLDDRHIPKLELYLCKVFRTQNSN
jgi:hypothetical protein